MGTHYNILITNPIGVRTYLFIDPVSLDICKEWRATYQPPKGWFYQTINLQRKVRLKFDHILITGFTPSGEFIAQVEAGHKTNNGWYSVKMAKRDLRKQGASWFKREKVWFNDKQLRKLPGED